MTKNRRGRPAAATRLRLPGSTFLTRANYYPYLHKKRGGGKPRPYALIFGTALLSCFWRLILLRLTHWVGPSLKSL